MVRPRRLCATFGPSTPEFARRPGRSLIKVERSDIPGTGWRKHGLAGHPGLVAAIACANGMARGGPRQSRVKTRIHYVIGIGLGLCEMSKDRSQRPRLASPPATAGMFELHPIEIRPSVSYPYSSPLVQ